MKGIILAGGKATRLYPTTLVTSKQLLPVYDKPMIYYPLSVLMLAEIKEILIISTPQDLPKFKELLGSGENIGVKFSYAEQDKPRGLADAFRVGKDFIGKDNVCLILGDNIFFGNGLGDMVREAAKNEKGATIFGYHVSDPERYGIVEFTKDGKILSIEEKPKIPKSNFAIPGLYFFDNKVVKFVDEIKPSARGELEITEIQKKYLEINELNLKIFYRGFAWLDAGTFDSMAEANEFVKAIQKKQGVKIACIEEIAYRMKFIDKEKLKKNAEGLLNSGYGEYLLKILEEDL